MRRMPQTRRPLRSPLGSSLVAALVMLPTGYLIYGVLFAFLFDEGAIRLDGVMKPMDLRWILPGQFAFALLLVLVIRWRGKTGALAGAQTGAILGLLMALGYDLPQYGTTHLWTMRATLIDPLLTAALVGISGAAVGWWDGRAPQDP